MKHFLLPGLILIVFVTAAGAESREVEVRGAGGFPLAGTFFSAKSEGPAILLLHQCNGDRSGYDDLGAQLSKAGYHVLSIDFRGFGESKGKGRNVDFRTQRNEIWPLFSSDVDAAFEFVTKQKGVDGSRIGVLGASCGGTQAAELSLRRPEVKAIVLLSSSLPWMSEEQIIAFEATSAVPVLCIASDGDRTTADVARKVFGKSKNPGSRLIFYKGSLHGAPLFEQDDSLEGQIVSWFRQNL